MKHTIFSLLLSLFVFTQANAFVINADFEDGTLGEIATPPSGTAFKETVFSNEKVHSGKQSAKATVLAGTTGFGDWGFIWHYPKLYEGDEIWYRVWFYFPDDFVYDPEQPGVKGLRVKVFRADGESRYINIYPKIAHLLLENWVDLKAYYDNNAKLDMRISPKLQGKWEAVELYVKFSSTPGKGIVRAWRNGNLWFEDRKTQTLMGSGSYSSTIYLLTFYSNNKSAITQHNFIDDVIITNERPSNTDSSGNPFIGVGDATFTPPTSPPSPPSGIK